MVKVDPRSRVIQFEMSKSIPNVLIVCIVGWDYNFHICGVQIFCISLAETTKFDLFRDYLANFKKF